MCVKNEGGKKNHPVHDTDTGRRKANDRKKKI